MIPLSAETQRRIDALFPENDRERVSEHLLHECGDNLPMVDASYHQLAERIQFAVLKLSNGDFRRLTEQTEAAAKDWRDVLMAAGFGENLVAHLAWEPHTPSGTRGSGQQP
ncbi:MAG: hypothetical protein JSV45_06780 [Chromatiales bacterium]|nr:MAG: hypothetical protein JSV45_06780 [Chromatiales bacterium]